MDDPCGDADCADAVDSLHAFIDGELTEDRRSRIQAHLDGCHGCFGAFGFEADLKHVIADRSAERVPDDLRRRITELLGDA